MKRFRGILLSCMSVICITACGPDASLPQWLQIPQIVVTEAVPSVFSATLSADITSSGNLTGCGFLITDAAGKVTEYACDLSEDGFRCRISGLLPDSEYAYSAFVANGSYRIVSREKSFRTDSFPGMGPVTWYAEPFSITLRSRFQGEALPENAGFSLTEEGREDGKDTACFDGTPDLSCRFDGLVPETAYRIVPWLQVEKQRIGLEPLRVETPAEPDDRIASSSVKSDVFTASFSATLSRKEGLTACGFAWSEAGGSFTEREASPEGSGFSLTVDGLSSDTEYLYYAWAEAYGRRFRTEPLPFRTKRRPFEDIKILSLEVTPLSCGADLAATLSAADGVTECGFGLSLNGRDFIEYSGVLEGSVFRVAVRGLLPDTEYVCYGFFFYDTQMVQTAYQTFKTL